MEDDQLATRKLYDDDQDEELTENKLKPVSASNYSTHIIQHGTNILVKTSSHGRETGQTSSMVNVAEKETEDSANLISSELKKVKQFARAKSQQKNARKLFRPQTGTVEGRKKAFGLMPHSRQAESGLDLGQPGLAAFEIAQSQLRGELSSTVFMPPSGTVTR